ncbi:MAG: hypothetical protein AVDCRST_MAG15-2963, partial [uncultured Rubellimicrobium sp.]
WPTTARTASASAPMRSGSRTAARRVGTRSTGSKPAKRRRAAPQGRSTTTPRCRTETSRPASPWTRSRRASTRAP